MIDVEAILHLYCINLMVIIGVKMLLVFFHVLEHIDNIKAIKITKKKTEIVFGLEIISGVIQISDFSAQKNISGSLQIADPELTFS